MAQVLQEPAQRAISRPRRQTTGSAVPPRCSQCSKRRSREETERFSNQSILPFYLWYLQRLSESCQGTSQWGQVRMSHYGQPRGSNKGTVCNQSPLLNKSESLGERKPYRCCRGHIECPCRHFGRHKLLGSIDCPASYQ